MYFGEDALLQFMSMLYIMLTVRQTCTCLGVVCAMSLIVVPCQCGGAGSALRNVRMYYAIRGRGHVYAFNIICNNVCMFPMG